jgi:radical SAM superfamily enzyme with C-terminal helix-hairpin-helix motif
MFVPELKNTLKKHMQATHYMTRIKITDKEFSLINRIGVLLKRIAHFNTNQLAEKEKDITHNQNKQVNNYRTTIKKNIFDNDGI